jgi:hypothetical protein
MRIRLTALTGVLAASLACGAAAAEGVSGVEAWRADPQAILDATQVDIDAFRWIARPIVVFADTEADPAFVRQLELIAGRRQELADRDVVVIVDTDPGGQSELRQQLRPRGFMLTLIGKDGGVKLRKPFPWDVRELSRSIDKMPIRQQEIRDRQRQGVGAEP